MTPWHPAVEVGERVFLGGWESGGGDYMHFGASDVWQLMTIMMTMPTIPQMAPAMCRRCILGVKDDTLP
eukprot:11078-Ditylum_brightwellii.AAC.1